MWVKLSGPQFERIFEASNIHSELGLKRDNPLELTPEQAEGLLRYAESVADSALCDGAGLGGSAESRSMTALARKLRTARGGGK